MPSNNVDADSKPRLFCQTWGGNRGKGKGAIVEALNQMKDGKEALCFTGDQNSCVDNAFVKQLCTALIDNKSVRLLQLDKNSLGDGAADYLGEALAGNESITSLDLDMNRIGDMGVIQLSLALHQNSKLEVLSLYGNQIGPAGATTFGKALDVNKTLRELSLHGNPIKDAGVVGIFDGLLKNRALRILDLAGCGISDHGAMHLAGVLKFNSALRELHLNRNAVSDSGAKELATMLRSNATLQQLHMDSNEVGDVGAHALSKALQFNTTLKELCLLDNPINKLASKLAGHKVILVRRGGFENDENQAPDNKGSPFVSSMDDDDLKSQTCAVFDESDVPKKMPNMSGGNVLKTVDGYNWDAPSEVDTSKAGVSRDVRAHDVSGSGGISVSAAGELMPEEDGELATVAPSSRPALGGPAAALDAAPAEGISRTISGEVREKVEELEREHKVSV